MCYFDGLAFHFLFHSLPPASSSPNDPHQSRQLPVRDPSCVTIRLRPHASLRQPRALKGPTENLAPPGGFAAFPERPSAKKHV